MTSVVLNDVGVYRIGTRAIDRELNLSARPSAVVRIGGATGEPPIAVAAIDRQSGPAPLTVSIDLSASFDPDGSIRNYFFNCIGGTLTGSQGSTGSCTFDRPGSYWIVLQVEDDSHNVDLVSAYAVATPVPSAAKVHGDDRGIGRARHLRCQSRGLHRRFERGLLRHHDSL